MIGSVKSQERIRKMGRYVNPGNKAFRRICGSNYVDKTNLISKLNQRIGGDDPLVCVSRPRRFGKSYAAQMLMAYYDCSCDSHELFDHMLVAQSEGYRQHLNHYNVICLDIAGFISEVRAHLGPMKSIPDRIEKALWKDLVESGFQPHEGDTLCDFLTRIVHQKEGKPFVFIIDEWDAVMREAKDDPDAQAAYLTLLRGWFKNLNFTPEVVAAAYMTGILPIKKDGTQSAISAFDESSMLDPLEFAEFVGFTEDEVKARCRAYDVDFEEIKAWYDGYKLPVVGSVYNPFSVMKALKSGKCRSYWRKTSAAESLKSYINLDFSGLQETVARLIAGDRVPVHVEYFQNNFDSFKSADDVLTLLIHLGYLSYDEAEKMVRIPNEEVRIEFRQFLL